MNRHLNSTDFDATPKRSYSRPGRDEFERRPPTSELAEPLFDMLRDLAVSGAVTAKEEYGARGWVLHHNTDLWRGTAPINASNHGIWPTGGAWLSQNLWWHYQYGGIRSSSAAPPTRS